MEPQIVVSEGRHNESVASLKRIKASGVWKKQNVVAVIPAAATIPTKVALSHWNLIFPPNNAAYRMAAIGMEVGEAYSQTFEFILNHPYLSKWQYILTIEHDNMPPSDGLLKLIESMEANPKYTAISGLYWTKGEGGVPQIWGDPKDPVLNFRPQVPVPETLQECCGIGMGFALWSIRKLKDMRLPKPMFITKKGNGGVTTQDLYFWSEARKYGHQCAVDTRVKVGHYDAERDIIW